MAEKRTTWGPLGGVAGTCKVCGEPARSGKAFYCEGHRPDLKGTTPPEVTEVLDRTRSEAGGAYSEESRPGPTPSAATGGFLGKLKGEKKPAAPRETDEKRPVVAARRRVSTADFWGDGVEGLSTVASRAGYVPMGRAMAWSSPVAGEIIEDATKGTPVDRLVQPVVRNAERWQDLFDLIGFWGAVGFAQRNPAKEQMALGFARKRLVNLLPKIAKNIKAQRAKEREAVQALTEVMPDLREMFPDAPPDADPMDLLMAMLFAAPEAPAEERVGVP